MLPAGGRYTRSGDITLPDGLTGPVYVRVTTGGPFEFINTDDDAIVSGPVAIALAPSPDLIVTGITAPGGSTEGGVIDITWTVANDASAPAVGTWRDQVALRKSGDPNAPVVQLGSFAYDAGLGAGPVLHADRALPVARADRGRLAGGDHHDPGAGQHGATGPYEHGSAAENNTTGDDQSLLLSLLARPDLQVQSVTAPDHVAAGTAFFSVSFTVVNRGTATDDAALEGQRLPVARQQAERRRHPHRRASATAPRSAHATATRQPDRDLRGPRSLPRRRLHPGRRRRQRQPSTSTRAEDNNFAAGPIFVEPQPLADLVTGDVVAPTQAVYGGRDRGPLHGHQQGLGAHR